MEITISGEIPGVGKTVVVIKDKNPKKAVEAYLEIVKKLR